VNTFDIIIIGSGAGGGTIARELASTGAKILIAERGDFIPQEDHNWNPASVWKDLRYRTTETWLDEAGRSFRPYTHYCVGGNTKFWGTVMYRLRPSDFKEVQHAEGISPAWPIDYDTLAPYYDRAEAMYEVHGEAGLDPTEGPRKPYPFPPVPHSKVVGSIVEQLKAQGLHPSPLPLGLRENCVFCNTCNSFPCKIHAKSDADVCAVRPATASGNVTLWVNATARKLVTDVTGIKQVDGQVSFVRPMFQGKLTADVVMQGDAPHFATFQIGAYRVDQVAKGTSPAPTRALAVELDASAIRQKPEPPFQQAKQAVDLSQAERIVSVGRGIKEQANIAIAQQLADALGAEIAASRPICDAGWLPMERQVGSSGQTVAPKLYVALGISGAIQHLVGMKGSNTVVAINKDADAPIFEIADYGIVGDLFEIVPAIIQAVKG